MKNKEQASDNQYLNNNVKDHTELLRRLKQGDSDFVADHESIETLSRCFLEAQGKALDKQVVLKALERNKGLKKMGFYTLSTGMLLSKGSEKNAWGKRLLTHLEKGETTIRHFLIKLPHIKQGYAPSVKLETAKLLLSRGRTVIKDLLELRRDLGFRQFEGVVSNCLWLIQKLPVAQQIQFVMLLCREGKGLLDQNYGLFKKTILATFNQEEEWGVRSFIEVCAAIPRVYQSQRVYGFAKKFFLDNSDNFKENNVVDEVVHGFDSSRDQKYLSALSYMLLRCFPGRKHQALVDFLAKSPGLVEQDLYLWLYAIIYQSKDLIDESNKVLHPHFLDAPVDKIIPVVANNRLLLKYLGGNRDGEDWALNQLNLYFTKHLNTIRALVLSEKNTELLQDVLFLIDCMSFGDQANYVFFWQELFKDYTDSDGYIERAILSSRAENSKKHLLLWEDVGRYFSVITSVKTLEYNGGIDVYMPNLLLPFLSSMNQGFALSSEPDVVRRLFHYYHDHLEGVYPLHTDVPDAYPLHKLSLWVKLYKAIQGKFGIDIKKLSDIHKRSFCYAMKVYNLFSATEIGSSMRTRPELSMYMVKMGVEAQPIEQKYFWEFLTLLGVSTMKVSQKPRDTLEKAVGYFNSGLPRVFSELDESTGWHMKYLCDYFVLLIEFVEKTRGMNLKGWASLEERVREYFSTRYTLPVESLLSAYSVRPELVFWVLKDDAARQRLLELNQYISPELYSIEVLSFAFDVELRKMLAKNEDCVLRSEYVDNILKKTYKTQGCSGVSSLLQFVIDGRDPFVLVCMIEHIQRLVKERQIDKLSMLVQRKPGYQHTIRSGYVDDIVLSRFFGSGIPRSKQMTSALHNCVVDVIRNALNTDDAPKVEDPEEYFGLIYLLAKNYDLLDQSALGVLLEGICQMSRNRKLQYILDREVLPEVLKEDRMVDALSHTTLSIMGVQRLKLPYKNWNRLKRVLPAELDPTPEELMLSLANPDAMDSVFDKLTRIMKMFKEDPLLKSQRSRIIEYNYPSISYLLLQAIQGKYVHLHDKTLDKVVFWPRFEEFTSLKELSRWALWAKIGKPQKLHDLIEKASQPKRLSEVATWVVCTIKNKVKALYGFIEKHLAAKIHDSLGLIDGEGLPKYVQEIADLLMPPGHTELGSLKHLAEALVVSTKPDDEVDAYYLKHNNQSFRSISKRTSAV